MEFIDIASLRWSDIQDGRIVYERSKTHKVFSIKLLAPAIEVLDHYKHFNPNNPYIFPILNSSVTDPEQVRAKAKNALKRVNKNLKVIAKAVEIEKRLTSKIARHTYASVLKTEGVAEMVISENLGLDDIQTTKGYLSSLGHDVHDKADENLL